MVTLQTTFFQPIITEENYMEEEKIEQVAKRLMSGLPSGHQIYESPHTQCQNFPIPAILPHHKGRKMILYKERHILYSYCL